MNEHPFETAGPLAGLRVIEIGGINGQYCGKLLADMGADVVKVEPPTGDEARRTNSGIMRTARKGGRPSYAAKRHIRAVQEF